MDYVKGADTCGTSFQGCINATYDELVKLFGEPDKEYDNFKSDAEWSGLLNDVVFTIYNWKDGKNYCGARGMRTEDITHWHIGGKSKQAVWNVERYLMLGGKGI